MKRLEGSHHKILNIITLTLPWVCNLFPVLQVVSIGRPVVQGGKQTMNNEKKNPLCWMLDDPCQNPPPLKFQLISHLSQELQICGSHTIQHQEWQVSTRYAVNAHQPWYKLKVTLFIENFKHYHQDVLNYCMNIVLSQFVAATLT